MWHGLANREGEGFSGAGCCYKLQYSQRERDQAPIAESWMGDFTIYAFTLGIMAYGYAIICGAILAVEGRSALPVLINAPLFIILPNLARIGFESHWLLGALGVFVMIAYFSGLLIRYSDWGNAAAKAVVHRVRRDSPVWKDWASMELEDLRIRLKVRASEWTDRITVFRSRK